MPAKYLLDASAVLAMLRKEPGWEVVRDLLPEAQISAVTLVEVLTKAIQKGVPPEDAAQALRDIGLPVLPVHEGHAYASAAVAPLAWKAGLSLADRLCITMATTHNLAAVTSDKSWASLRLKGLAVKLIR
ncbi:MAG: type II toxin-antitoxin system VapC family toxin [Acidobacteriota bacterium]